MIIAALQNDNIECRPLIAGSMDLQPFYKAKYKPHFDLVNAHMVSKIGLYVPNHPGMDENDVKRVCKVINSVIG